MRTPAVVVLWKPGLYSCGHIRSCLDPAYPAATATAAHCDGAKPVTLHGFEHKLILLTGKVLLAVLLGDHIVRHALLLRVNRLSLRHQRKNFLMQCGDQSNGRAIG